MPRTISIYGDSDDLVTVQDSKNKLTDEYHPGYIGGSVSKLLVSVPTGQMVVLITYARHKAMWDVAIAPVGEMVPIPDVLMVFKLAKNGYSTELMITVPDDGYISLCELK